MHRRNTGAGYTVPDWGSSKRSPVPWLEPWLVGNEGQLPDVNLHGGRPMAKTSPARRLSRITRSGVAELPNNAAWLLAKALKPATSAAAGASSVAGGVSDAASST